MKNVVPAEAQLGQSWTNKQASHLDVKPMRQDISKVRDEKSFIVPQSRQSSEEIC